MTLDAQGEHTSHGGGMTVAESVTLPMPIARPVPLGAANGASQTDEALMMAYCRGDLAAFKLLYARHRGGLYRFLLRQCGVPAIAEELFQDVWTNLIRARSRYAANARFATYLYRIAHNRLIDHFRRSVHRPSVDVSDPDTDPVEHLEADAIYQPEVRFFTESHIQRFTQLLESLPREQREAFVMRQEAELTIEEIAAATGVNLETAKSRLRYAVSKLRRGLMESM